MGIWILNVWMSAMRAAVEEIMAFVEFFVKAERARRFCEG